MQTRDQRYAAEIFRQVSEFKTLKDSEGKQSDYKEYGAMAHKLPVLIRTAGLAQALAFVQARGKDPHKQLLNHLAKVVNFTNGDALAHRSREADLEAYMYLTEQTLAALLWYKRFAQSVLEVESGEGDSR